jgi:hypothetical protein
MNQTEIWSKYKSLCSPPDTADAGWYQRRGYQFEKLLNELLTRDELAPRLSYKSKGEQIDGSFLCDGRIFLLEAKWHKKPTSASTIYAFKGKVEGKLVGTLGVFISMAGFTNDCVDALVLGKSLDVLLFDQDDMTTAVSKTGAFAELLRLRMREAAETGSVYRSSAPGDPAQTPYSSTTIEEPIPLSEDTLQKKVGGPVAILCEGRMDSLVLNDLALRILKRNGLKAEIRVVQAGGKQNLPRVANLFSGASEAGTVIVVVDTDGEVDSTTRLVRDGLTYEGYHLIMPDPCIETWLLKGDKAEAATSRARELTERRHLSSRKVEEFLDLVDIEHLRTTDREFSLFYDIIKNAGQKPNNFFA